LSRSAVDLEQKAGAVELEGIYFDSGLEQWQKLQIQTQSVEREERVRGKSLPPAV